MHLRVGQHVVADGPSEVFEVVELLGEGRTSGVYKVRDVAPGPLADSRRVRMAESGLFSDFYALKLARGRLGRFNGLIEREADALLDLAHPGICRAVSYGHLKDRAFLVTELLQGRPLLEYLQEFRTRFGVRMRVLLRIAEAIAHCHEVGLAYRDLRPSNIWMVPDRGPVLIGFEWCAWFDESTTDLEGLEPVEPIGAAEYRPEYLSQPMFDDELYPSAAQEDVYALGVLLYALLTGKLPERELAPPPSDAPPRCLELAEQLLSHHRPPDALAVPLLVREAMKQDEALLSRFAPAYEAGAETLPSLEEERSRWYQRAADWLRERDPFRVTL